MSPMGYGRSRVLRLRLRLHAEGVNINVKVVCARDRCFLSETLDSTKENASKPSLPSRISYITYSGATKKPSCVVMSIR